MRLPRKILALHQALTAAQLPHAFGGALALAWCTERARGTVDIDLNVLVETEHADQVLAALPEPVGSTAEDSQTLQRDGQIRLWWDTTPTDLFLNTTEFHRQIAERCRWEDFGGDLLPFLSCSDLAVFKAYFDRPRDWADLAEMQAAGTLDLDRVLGVTLRYLGGDDHRIQRLQDLG